MSRIPLLLIPTLAALALACGDKDETGSDTGNADTEGAESCACEDDGATLTPVSGCENWPDATECSGWASVAESNGEDPEGNYEDGTELTYSDGSCTIRINCPD